MSMVKGFGMGFGSLIRGFGFVFSHPRLWFLAIVPTIINLIILAVMLIAFAHYYGDFYGWLSAHVGKLDIANPTAWYWHVLDAILWFINLILQLLVVLISLILILLVAYGLSFVIAGPFNDVLSERVETIVTGLQPPPFAFGKFVADIIRVVRTEAIKAVVLIAIPVVLLVVNFIPIVGGPIYIVLSLMFGAWDLGFSYADLPFGRRAAPFSERWAFALRHRWALVGLGSGFVVPFFSLIFAAPMVVGGTLLYADLTMGVGDLTRRQRPY